MKIEVRGETVWFNCHSCGCVFRVGIHSAHTQDSGENYYADCPMCGESCHADVNARDSIKSQRN